MGQMEELMSEPAEVIESTLRGHLDGPCTICENYDQPSHLAADVIRALRGMSEPTMGVSLIAHERQRQIKEEGRSLDHDRTHKRQELAWAAACYAAPEPVFQRADVHGGVTYREPWPTEWTPNFNRGEPGWIPWRRPGADRVRELTKAGALIAAEIDRLLAAPVGDP